MVEKKKPSNASRVRKVLFSMCFGVCVALLLHKSIGDRLHLSRVRTNYLGVALAIVVGLLVASSAKVQCFILVALPHVCNKRGRTLLIAYTFVVCVSGPVANTTRNTEVVMHSLACDQKVLGNVVREIYEIVKRPLRAVKLVIEKVLKQMKMLILKLKRLLIRMKKAIVAIVKVIKRAFSFLAKAAHVCNREEGTPFERCKRLFDDANEQCHASFGLLNSLCNVNKAIKLICYSVKFVDYVCEFIEFVSHETLDVIVRNLRQFEQEIHNMLYVKVHFKHHFHFETNASKSFKQVRAEIGEEIRERTRMLMEVLGWMHMLLGVSFLWIMFYVICYISRYMTSDRFDNIYLNGAFYEIDRRRKDLDMDSVLPLRWKEKWKYINIKSPFFTKEERRQFCRRSTLLLTTTFQVGSMVFIDYSLYWLLAKVRHYGLKHSDIDVPPPFTFHVVGEGLIADIVHGIIRAFTPIVERFHVDVMPCLPQPYVPDLRGYTLLWILLSTAWLMLFCEPYVLRMRQAAMNAYHPDRAHERATWLYQQIVRRRLTFVKFARRQLRRKFRQDGRRGVEPVTCCNWLRARLGHIWLCAKLLGDNDETFCMLCCVSIRQSEDVRNCVQPDCFGVYCAECFEELRSSCPLCQNPMQYGDLSDVSEECDSSCDEDDQVEDTARGNNADADDNDDDGGSGDQPRPERKKSSMMLLDNETGDAFRFRSLPPETARYRRCKYF